MQVRILSVLCARIDSNSATVARGYTRSGQGNPDEARSARDILKDYVNGKLLFCHAPPNIPEESFNEQTHDSALLRAAGKKKAPTTRVGKGADTFVPSNVEDAPSDSTSILPAQGRGFKSKNVDHDFFENTSGLSAKPFMQSSLRHGEEFTRATLYPHQNAVANDGTPLGRRRIGGAPGDGKKSHKKMKRVKQRSGKGYD